MLSLAAILLVSSAAGNADVVLDRLASDMAYHGGTLGKVAAGIADKLVRLRVSSASDSDDQDTEDPDDADSELEVLPPIPPIPPVAPVAPVPPVPPVPPTPPAVRQRGFHFDKKGFDFRFEAETDLPRFTESGKNVPTVDLLHRIAQTAGWSMTLVGSPEQHVDIELKNVDPREALREVLKKSHAMGVLKGDKLVVVASPEASSAGMLVEQVDARRFKHVGQEATAVRKTRGKRSGRDVVKVFQGDVILHQGQIVQGDVVCVGGSVELEPGSVVQGDAVAVGGSVTVDEGALVLGQAVAVLGDVEVARGAQVMGEHVQVGFGKIFGSRPHARRGWLTSLGPFGLFPTIGLFALMHVIGLLVLRMWPDRVRNVGFAMFENPVRSFTVGFLCWLLLLPLIVLLAISIVGIPLIPLLPVIMFLSIVIGFSSFALRIGESLPAGPGQRFVPPAALGMGMAALLLLAFVPWLGISILALLQFFALGASVGSRFGRALPPHQP